MSIDQLQTIPSETFSVEATPQYLADINPIRLEEQPPQVLPEPGNQTTIAEAVVRSIASCTFPKTRSRRPEGDVKDQIKWYLDEVGGYQLLTKEDEQTLGAIIFEGRLASLELMESAAEQTEMDATHHGQLVGLVEQARQAKQVFIEANLRLVVSIARKKRYDRSGMPLLDRIQEGNTGLMHAVDLFDYRKGFKFSTYATSWIMQAIDRANADAGDTIRVPAHMQEKISALIRSRDVYRIEFPSDPDEVKARVCFDMRIAPAKYDEIVRAMSLQPISLETPYGRDGDAEIQDRVSDRNALIPDEAGLDTKSLEDMIKYLQAILSDVEIFVVLHRAGLIDGEVKKPGEIQILLDDLGYVNEKYADSAADIGKLAILKLRHPSARDVANRLFPSKAEETDWMESVSCGVELARLIFKSTPRTPEERTTLKQICASCPGREQCLELGHALPLKPGQGVWGGHYPIHKKGLVPLK